MSRQMHRRGASKSPPSRWSFDVPSILLAIVVVTSPMVIGGVHASTALAVAGLALLGLWWSIATTSGSSAQTPDFALSIPALGCGAMALLCLVQLIPVPTLLYRLVQPAGYEALLANWEVVYGTSPPSGWHLLSLDPRQTSTHALRWIALSATAALAAQVISNRKGRRRWLGLLLVCGTAVAIAGAAQYISDTDKILGVYEAQITARSIAPFVNTNHAAGFFGMMAVIAIAFSIDHLHRSPLKTTLGATAATVAIMLCAAHGSDGALLALVTSIGLIAITILTRATPTDDRQKRRRFITLAALGVLFAGAIAFFLMPDDWTVADQDSVLEETSAEFRIHMSQAALDAATDHPVVGSGAGSVERVLPPYLDWHYVGAATIPTVENEPVEWIMTLGPVALLIALGVFALIIFRTAPHIGRRRGRRGAAFSFVLVAFFSIISLFHFPFAALGVAIPFLVALEACVSKKRDGLHRFGSRRALAIFALALTLGLGGLWMSRATVLAPGPAQHLELGDDDEVQKALYLYPTDGVLMSAKSLRSRADEDDERAADLAQRAFELRPHPQQEFLLAASLANIDRGEEAAALYRSLFDKERHNYRRIYGWAQPRLRYDLRTAELRAMAMADSSVTLWRRFFRHLRDEEGPMAPVDVALELVELRPDDARAHLELIELYRHVEQDELAEMYARMLISRNLEDDQGRRPAGLLTLIDILRDRDRHSTEALHIADRAFDAGHTFPELGRTVLRLLPTDTETVADEHLRIFQTALEVGCHPPYESNYRHLCWRGQAFVAEADGELERAENYLRRISNLHENPQRLAAFYARHERCRDLAALKRDFEDTRYERHIEGRARECARRWELED